MDENHFNSVIAPQYGRALHRGITLHRSTPPCGSAPQLRNGVQYWREVRDAWVANWQAHKLLCQPAEALHALKCARYAEHYLRRARAWEHITWPV